MASALAFMAVAMRGLAKSSFTRETDKLHALPLPSTTIARATKSALHDSGYKSKNLRSFCTARTLLEGLLYSRYLGAGGGPSSGSGTVGAGGYLGACSGGFGFVSEFEI